MLKRLVVQNYAIINHVSLDFVSGFNVITGETGAGKSILLGALNLIRGGRADTKVLYDRNVKCIVEATFECNDPTLRLINEVEGIQLDDHIMTIRREISSTGKSRATINGQTARLHQIKAVSHHLVDIHNQFDTLTLTTQEYQLDLVDSIADNGDLRKTYRSDYNLLLQLRRELQQLENSKSTASSNLEYAKFQLEELELYPLDEIDKDQLLQEYNTLSNAEEIKLVLAKINDRLLSVEHSVDDQLRESLKEIGNIADDIPQLQEIADLIEQSVETLRDIELISGRMDDQLDVDEERVTQLREILDHIQMLENKHDVEGIPALLALRQSYSDQLSGTSNLTERITLKKKELESHGKQITKSAKALSTSRTAVTGTIAEQLANSLKDLAMPNAKVKFAYELLSDYEPAGVDQLTLCFSANKGVDPEPVSEVASGGELSRVALSAKSMVAELNAVPTLIFDEIDSGISGAVAQKVGQILAHMAFARQVVCITHSPQVASLAEHHFLIAKRDNANRTITTVHELDTTGRVHEIAKMLSTDPPSTFAIQNAEELLRRES